MRCPLLRRSDVVCSFLRDDTELFKRIKAGLKKTKRLTNPAEFPSPDGQLRCDIGTASDYTSRVSRLLLESQNVKYRIRKKGQEIASALSTLASGLRELSGLYSELDSVLNVLPEVKSQQNKVANKALCSTLSTALGSWSTSEGEASRQFKEAFSMHYKYEVAQIASLKSLLADREAAYTAYTKADQKLRAKKDKLWAQGNPSKWELAPGAPEVEILRKDKEAAVSFMLHGETQQFNKLRDTFGFFNFQAKAEVSQVLEETTFLDNQHFTDFTEFVSRNSALNSEIWSQAYSDLKAASNELIPEPHFLRII
jgi:hypothetical protein